MQTKIFIFFIFSRNLRIGKLFRIVENRSLSQFSGTGSLPLRPRNGYGAVTAVLKKRLKNETTAQRGENQLGEGMGNF